MKSLNSYIKNTYVTEGLFKNIGAEVVTVKTKRELKDLVDKTIEKEGPDCDLNFIDTSRITDMSYLFTESNFNGDISCRHVPIVEDMGSMFKDSNFNGDISGWDVSNVKSMNGMFYDSQFNGDISGWDVFKVDDMRYMFARSEFTGDISKWNISNMTNVSSMFYGGKFEKLDKSSK